MGKRNKEPLGAEEKRSLSAPNLKHLLEVFRFVLPYKWPFLLGISSLFLSSLTLLSFPYFAGMLLDLARKIVSAGSASLGEINGRKNHPCYCSPVKRH